LIDGRPGKPPREPAAPRIVTRLRLHERIGSMVAAAAMAGCLALGPPTARAAASAAPACAPSRLNMSAARAGGAVTVSPTPDSLDASYRTQISFVGVPAAALVGVSAVGARSGAHPGRLLPYSQGDGASFVPDTPFAQGEVVTVHAVLRAGSAAKRFSWQFTVADVDAVSRSLETPPPPPPPPSPGEIQQFISRPDLEPPTVTVTTDSGAQMPGDLFLAPYAGPGQYGPMILDGNGKLLWFKRLRAGARAADLRVQEYEGQPVLTWWQDPLIAGGHRGSGVVIANSSYQAIADVRAGNGYEPDLHAFEITPQGTALFTIYDAIRCDLSAYGGPANGAVADTVFQEMDLRTGLVRVEWHALDHVSLAASYGAATPGSPRSPWDYFHINGVSQHGADILVDSRNTSAAYQVDRRSGQVLWCLGGKQSSFAMGPGAAPAYQHDAREGPGGAITFFDNGGTPKVHSQSRAIVVRLDMERMTATLVSSYTHSKPLLAGSQGDFQPLSDGDWTVGWGQEPFFSEFSSDGQLLFDAHVPAAYQSYTVLKFGWSASPAEPPRLAVRGSSHGGIVAYASWNGATAVAQWRLLAGADAHALSADAATPRRGFETMIATGGSPAYVAVQALGAQGQVLGTSALARG
jgi:hypothetical protein